MLEYALGLVETRGLVGSIEAADVMVKTANVRLVGTEYIKNGLVTVKIVGEVAAVKSAVEAAAAAAQRVGQLVSTHVIPRPAEDIELVLQKAGVAPVPEKKEQQRKQKPKPAPEETEPPDVFQLTDDVAAYRAELEAMTVHQLRSVARHVGGLSIFGRQISKANKTQLIEELMKKRTAG
jgi:microcompartment protein CcmL/EutN